MEVESCVALKYTNKAKAISAELLELNLKNKLEETGGNGKKLEETGRNGKKRRNWRKKHRKW